MSRPSADRLSARWDTVPPERQAYYRGIYQRELREAGATTDDAAELIVLQRLISAYREQALVPVGNRWASVPERVQIAARKGRGLTNTDEKTTRSGIRSLHLLMLISLPLFVIGFILIQSLSGDRHASDTGTAQMTPTHTPTPTPVVSPTPTALALEASDRVIEAGSNRNRNYYPVLLQVDPADGQPARVFVVQERAIDTADWHFDPNPDVASWVSGLIVQPVIGLPFSDDNADLLASLSEGARFQLQMNTGATLAFDYAGRRQVRRQTTGIFSQIQPGIALVLIGATDRDGRLTSERLVVTGAYDPDQEVDRITSGELVSSVTLTPSPTPAPPTVDQLAVQMGNVTFDTTRLTVAVRLFNPTDQVVSLMEDRPALVTGLQPDPVGLAIASETTLPEQIMSGQALDLTLTFPYNNDPYGRLTLWGRTYALTIHRDPA